MPKLKLKISQIRPVGPVVDLQKKGILANLKVKIFCIGNLKKVFGTIEGKT